MTCRSSPSMSFLLSGVTLPPINRCGLDRGHRKEDGNCCVMQEQKDGHEEDHPRCRDGMSPMGSDCATDHQQCDGKDHGGKRIAETNSDFHRWIPFCRTRTLVASYFSKHDRHSTGRPCLGKKGTEVTCAHTAQVVLVSVQALDFPPFRALLQALQRLGSFENCFLRKNSCSSAVKTKSAPQSLHGKIRSTRTWVWNMRVGPAKRESMFVSMINCISQNKRAARFLPEMRQRTVGLVWWLWLS